MKLKIILVSLLLINCIQVLTAQVTDAIKTNIHPKRELRGAWIATVENIDWPKKPGEPAEVQQQELLTILDSLQHIGINAIFFQIRPAADAFYAKSREPWSKWLNGKQGTAPEPFYDPLAFAITEAHKRGMELHAWINPYRATNNAKYNELSPQHITNIKPEWFFQYDGMKLFNPGLPEVREYIVKVVLDIMNNYDIDGIHMDDYFYPYQVKGQVIADGQAFRDYNNGFTDLKNWRRNNVNLLVKMLSDSIRSYNTHIKFGVSPFGIWANKYQNPDGSNTHGGDSYYELYADARKWVKEGWVDYVAPQLYRPLNDRLMAFNVLVDWWANNTYNRHLYIGHAPYRIIENKLPGFKEASQLPNQVKYLRNNPRVQGSIYYNTNSLIQNPLGFADSLKGNLYRYPALPPAMLWRDSIAPNPPREAVAQIENNTIKLTWQAPDQAKDNEPAYGYVIYRFDQNDDLITTERSEKIVHIQFNADCSFTDKNIVKGNTYMYVITAIDKIKNESEHSIPVIIKVE